jgi:5-methylcytosine-specific restriction protein A
MLKNKKDFMEFGEFLQKSVQEFFPYTYREDDVQDIPGWSVFSIVTIPPKFHCHFRQWAGNPFHYVIENGNRKLSQLDLTRVIENEGLYTWYLSKPTNIFTKNIFDKLFEYYDEVPLEYREHVKEQKALLGSNPIIQKAGYLFVDNITLDELQDKFIDFLKTLYESVEKRIELKPKRNVQKIFDLEDLEAEEGYKQDKVYLYTTRNRDIVNKRKELDNYTCQVCGFHLEIKGKHLIECHHKNPLSEGDVRITNINDLESLCPTCHRIVHLRKPPFTIEEAKEIIGGKN